MSDRTIASSKLFQQNGMIIGLTGLTCEGSLMQIFSRNHKPAAATMDGVMDFLFEFDDWVRKRDSSLRPENHYLIALDGHLFRSYGGINVFEVSEFAAIGAGEEFAITAMHLHKTPREAVVVACELSVWCGEPIAEFSCPHP